MLYNVFRGAESWRAYASRFMLPTVICNTLGGVVLIAARNCSQVAAD